MVAASVNEAVLRALTQDLPSDKLKFGAVDQRNGAELKKSDDDALVNEDKQISMSPVSAVEASPNMADFTKSFEDTLTKRYRTVRRRA